MLYFIAEFQRRMKLAELGYHTDISKLSARKAEIFISIASAYQEISEKKMQEKSRSS